MDAGCGGSILSSPLVFELESGIEVSGYDECGHPNKDKSETYVVLNRVVGLVAVRGIRVWGTKSGQTCLTTKEGQFLGE